MTTNRITATPNGEVPDTVDTEPSPTGQLGRLTRPTYIPLPKNEPEAEPNIEPQLDAKALLADQDAIIDEDAQLGAPTVVEAEAEFVLEADEDWFGEIQRSQQVAHDSLVKAHIQTAAGKGYRSPEEVKAAQDAATKRATKRTAWFWVSLILTAMTALVVVASIVLAGGVT